MFDSENTAGGASDSTATTDQRPGEGEKGDDKAALQRMGEQRDAARADAKRMQEERDALLQEKTAREAADQKARDDDAKKRGEFETLAATREAERDEARTEAATLRAENDQLRAAMAAGIEAGWKNLPESVRKIGEKQHGDEDVLGRFQFLHDPDTAALVKQLSEREPTKPGNGRDPKSSGRSRNTVEQEAAALRQRGGYAM